MATGTGHDVELSLSTQGRLALLTVTIHGDGPPVVLCIRVDGASTKPRLVDIDERANFVDYERLVEYVDFSDDDVEERTTNTCRAR
jgi:hypothetical protein